MRWFSFDEVAEHWVNDVFVTRLGGLFVISWEYTGLTHSRFPGARVCVYVCVCMCVCVCLCQMCCIARILRTPPQQLYWGLVVAARS